MDARPEEATEACARARCEEEKTRGQSSHSRRLMSVNSNAVGCSSFFFPSFLGSSLNGARCARTSRVIMPRG